MDFTSHGNIEIRGEDDHDPQDNWGPYTFDFEDSMPSGAVISGVTFDVFLGKVKPSTDFSAVTQCAASLFVDPDYAPNIQNNTVVYVKFQYPGDSYRGNKYTLIFNLNLQGGGERPFFFHSLKVP